MYLSLVVCYEEFVFITILKNKKAYMECELCLSDLCFQIYAQIQKSMLWNDVRNVSHFLT